MDRQDILKRLLYPKCKSAIEFKFDNLIVNPMLSYITVQDIAQLNKIATSLKYSSKPKEKYIMIDNIMANRGFKKMASGTNRVTYRCLNDYRVVLKIAIDKVGLSDNGNEYRNQHLLKPFVTKCFEVSPCGTVGLFERVVPITSREEFLNISDDIFDLINNLIGKYVLEDIGEKFYMNYGLREGFGPVLLDYPYVFELDGRKLKCNVPEPMELKGYCGGEIDYDIGYNNLICTKCGKRYLATELKSDSKSDKPKIIIEGEDTIMRCVLKRGDEVVSDLNSNSVVATNTIKSKKDFVKLKAQLSTDTVDESDEPAERKRTIKTSDEVNLTVRLRGNYPSKDIDKIARDKEALKDAATEKIKVDLDAVEEVVPAHVSNFDARISGIEESIVATQNDKEYADDSDILINYEENEKSDSAKTYSDDTFVAIIKNDGEIWDYHKNEIIGYTKDGVLSRLREEYDVEVEDIEAANEDIKVTDTSETKPIKSSEFKGNENYKTTDIVSPIEGHFTKAEDKVEETEKVEPVEEDEREIPELIIHMREDEETASDEEYDGEDYDPEYSDNDDSEEETENKIDLY